MPSSVSPDQSLIDFEPVTRNDLHYPYGTEGPKEGEVVKLAEGVYWTRQPLYPPLNWINVWLLRDDDQTGEGWTIVDTGIGSTATRKNWKRLFGEVMESLPVKRVVVTHMHPDHCGLAGWLCHKFDGARLWMTRLEYTMCRMLVGDTGRNAPDYAIKFYRSVGWEEEAIDRFINRFGGYGEAMFPMPDGYKRIEGGDVLKIGQYEWRVVHGHGHSPEHACLLNEELNMLISGDQILPRISSNVSVFPTEPDANPLKDWLESCEKLQTEIPEDVLVLPAHNTPFYGAHTRLKQLIDGHNIGLDRLLKRLKEPKRAIDVFGCLFARKIGPDVLSMATGEAIAHLNYLIEEGKARKFLDDEGVEHYIAT